MSLISITKAHVPDYLVGSEFYSSLSSEDDEAFSIPSNRMKMTPDVLTPSDLRHLLHTVQFWGLQKVPNDVFRYLVHKVERDVGDRIIEVLEEFDCSVPLTMLLLSFQPAENDRQRLEAAVYSKRSDVMEYLICFNKPVNISMVKSAADCGLLDVLVRASDELRAKGKDPFVHVALCNVAAAGHTECLRYLLTNGCKKVRNVCTTAAENGHLECLFVAHSLGCSWDGKTTSAAALHGRLGCLVFALEEGCPVGSSAASNAALGGYFDCLHLLLEYGEPLTPKLVASACQGGYVDCLMLLLNNDCPVDASCARAAVKMGHSTCLQCVVEYGCPLNAGVADTAAALGHEECLSYLYDIGLDASCKRGHIKCLDLMYDYDIHLTASVLRKAMSFYTDEACVRCVANLLLVGYYLPVGVNWASVAVEQRHPECLEYICTHTYNNTLDIHDAVVAARNGDVSILKVLYEHHCPWGVEVCNAAVMSKSTESLAALEFLHQKGCPWDSTTTDAAVTTRNGVCFKYAVQNHCPMGIVTIAHCALNGKLRILELHHRRRGTFNTSASASAIQGGHLDCLRYCVQHGAPLKAVLCAIAARAKIHALELLQYLHEEAHCPWDIRTCINAAQRDTVGVLMYAHVHGCGWDAAVSRAACVSPRCLRYCVEQGCPIDEVTMEVYNRQRKG